MNNITIMKRRSQFPVQFSSIQFLLLIKLMIHLRTRPCADMHQLDLVSSGFQRQIQLRRHRTRVCTYRVFNLTSWTSESGSKTRSGLAFKFNEIKFALACPKAPLCSVSILLFARFLKVSYKQVNICNSNGISWRFASQAKLTGVWVTWERQKFLRTELNLADCCLASWMKFVNVNWLAFDAERWTLHNKIYLQNLNLFKLRESSLWDALDGV